jgi:ferric iron reductase protein FhuF
MSTAAADALAALTERVPFLRWRIGEPTGDELVGADLAADPDVLAAAITASRPAWDIDDAMVLASLWWQAYAYRVAGTSLACWLLTGVGPIPVAVGIGRHRPASIVCSDATETELDALVERLFAGHLDPVAASLRDRHRAGEQLLWGNAAAGVASALLALAGADESTPELRQKAPAVTEALPHDMPTLGRWHDGEYTRTTCCLWFKTPSAKGGYCSDCLLVR